MSEEKNEFELAHWKSRAGVAEKELASARSVLSTLRVYFAKLDPTHPLFGRLIAANIDHVREQLRGHDQTYWTRDHAVNAVAEGIAGIVNDPPSAEEASQRTLDRIKKLRTEGDK